MHIDYYHLHRYLLMIIIFNELKSSMMIMIAVMENKNLFELVSIMWARKQLGGDEYR